MVSNELYDLNEFFGISSLCYGVNSFARFPMDFNCITQENLFFPSI